MTPRTWLMTALAATAALAAAGQAQALPGQLGAYGTRAEIVYAGSNGVVVDGGTGHTTASKDASIYNSGGYGIHGVAAGGLSSGALHSFSFASHEECHSVVPYYYCSGTGVGSRVAMWDSVTFLDVDGYPREVSSLIPLSITVDGDLQGETKGALLRTYFGFDSNLDPETLPWINIGAGETELLDTLFVPLTDAPMFLYFELYTYAGTTGELSTTATADYLNTLHFNWELPDDVTAVSASGVFLSDLSAAPEPASWALMLAGFGAAGATLRARRRRLA